MFKIITTLGPGNWEQYGERFVKSFLKYWPAGTRLEIYHHHLGDNVPSYPGVTFKRLDDMQAFKNIAQAFPGAQNGPSLGFAFKAVALASAVEPELDWLAFVDADTETMRPITDQLLAELFDPAYDLTYLFRRGIKESEGSWFAFNLTDLRGASLLSDYWGMYNTLEAYQYKKSHDNAVLDRLVMIHQAHGLRVKNLAEGSIGLDAFHQSPLGGYMIHYKGPDKQTIANPAIGAPGRYGTLCNILDWAIQRDKQTQETGRATIIEVGTWNGSRAIQMAEAAFKNIDAVHYIGFDTFDDGNDRELEGHTKPHASHQLVRMRLENYGVLMARAGKHFTFELVKGNTLATLPWTELPQHATLAYIDGGHSYETVKSDYAHLHAVAPYIVFDDVIVNDEPGAPDGPRRVWEEAGRTAQRMLYTSGDGYAGLTQPISFGIIVRNGWERPQLQQQLRVQPVDSVDKSEQLEHIKANSAAVKDWLKTYQAHERVALLVSAGPTLPDYFDDIRQKQAAGAKVFAVKHAYPILKAAGITPDFTVVLDPRPIDGMSTHGILRRNLFADMVPGENVLLATMTHPSVREVLEEKSAHILGWHAFTQGTQEARLPEFNTGLIVGGGTCAATRMPMLAFITGFRRLEFYGYDFFYPANVDPATLKQTLIRVTLGKEKPLELLTTGELIAAMQDLEPWSKWMADNRLSVTFHGNGGGAAVWNNTIINYRPPVEYDL